MIADTIHNDLTGSSSADISDNLTEHNSIEELAKHFKIDLNKYTPVGIELYGTEEMSLSFLCIDVTKSVSGNDCYIKIHIDKEIDNVLSLLFKRFQVVLFSEYKNNYNSKSFNEIRNLSDIEIFGS